MGHRKVDVEQAYLQYSQSSLANSFGHTHQFRVGVDDLGNALPRKGLFSETPLDIVEDFCMMGV